MNEFQVASLGIGKVNGNGTQVKLVEAEVMEAVTWYEGLKCLNIEKDIGMLCRNLSIYD